MDGRLQRLMQGGMGGGAGGPPADTPQVDTAEQIYISSLALLKMLKHGKHTNLCSGNFKQTACLQVSILWQLDTSP
jgi:hypothetical protein